MKYKTDYWAVKTNFLAMLPPDVCRWKNLLG